jgi:DNA topoisomerase VI subunit B
MDYQGEPFDVEAGIGFGLTAGSDNLVLKLMFSRDLN